MVTTNVSIDDPLTNGQLVTIGDTKQDSSDTNLSNLKMKCRINKNEIDRYASENNFVSIVRIEANVSVSLNSRLTIHQTQFPSMLAFACTVHKVQGMTLPSIVLSFSLKRKKKDKFM